MSRSKTQSGWSQNVADPSYPTQSSLSRTTELESDLFLHEQPAQYSGQTTMASSSSPSQSQYLPSALSGPSARPGFFAGSPHVDANNGTFNDVGRDQYNYIEIKGNDMFVVNKLPRAKDAGYRSEHHRKCLPGTRRAELERIEKWELDYEDKRVYWLNGLAGTGKSTIAKTFAERSSAGGRLGASFFCSRDFPDRRNIHLIFPTIAFGLAHRYPEFREALMEAMISSPDAAEESLAIQLEDLLVRPLKATNIRTTIVIDALDECEDDKPASAILSLLAQHIGAIPSVKFFITGRPEVPIRTGFRLRLLQPHTEVFVLHDVDPSSVNQDIELYLRTSLTEIAAERSNLDLTNPWPAEDDISFLVGRCSGLFIVASILARLIGEHLEPQEQLKVIIIEADSTIREGRSGVDAIYHHVFLQSLRIAGDILDTDALDLLRLVVGSIVSVFNPLSSADLAKILDVPQGRIGNTIRYLHSVLIVPDSNLQLLRICHKSLADFLTDLRRCIDARFYIEPPVLHTKLGIHCLKLMCGSLRENICNFPPYALNRDIKDIDARREKHIGGGLEYACRSWAKHLRFASRSDDVGCVIELLECFFRRHLLSWLEVLSIVGDMRCAVYSVRDVRGWLIKVDSPDTNLLDILADSERFILRFFDVIEASARHLYHSALPWSPRTSLIRALYKDQLSMEVMMFNPTDESWDASTRKIQTRADVCYIAFSCKDDFIAVGEKGCVEVFETLTGHRRATFTSSENAQYWSLAFSPDDTLLASGRGDGKISVWDLQTGGLVCGLERHNGPVTSVAFSSCGTMIAFCSSDRTVRIWSLSSRDCRCVLEYSDFVTSVCWSATRNQVISGSVDGMVMAWDIIGENCVKTFSGIQGEVLSVACSPDSSFIASGSNYEVKIFKAQTGDVFRTISTDGSIQLVRFLDQDTLMYANKSTFIIHHLTETTNTRTPKSKNWLKRCFRTARTGVKLLQGQRHDNKTNLHVLMFKHQGDRPAISSNGTRIASMTHDRVVTIWQTDGPSPAHVHDTASHRDIVNSVAVSQGGQLMASGSRDGTAKLWDPTSGRCLHTFNHPYEVKLVIFSPDSTLLASLTVRDNTLRIWNTRTHKLISTPEDPLHIASLDARSLVFSPNGNQLVCLGQQYGSNHLKLWDVATGRCLVSTLINGGFEKVSFGIDGSDIILEKGGSTKRYRISPIQSSSDNDKYMHSSFPMEFIRLHDTQQFVSSHQQSVSSHLHCYQRGNEWILDEQERWVLWVPLDLRDVDHFYSYGKVAVLTFPSGKVLIADFLNVQY